MNHELQIIELEIVEKPIKESDIFYQYEELNKKLDIILNKIKIRRSKKIQQK